MTLIDTYNKLFQPRPQLLHEKLISFIEDSINNSGLFDTRFSDLHDALNIDHQHIIDISVERDVHPVYEVRLSSPIYIISGQRFITVNIHGIVSMRFVIQYINDQASVRLLSTNVSDGDEDVM